MSIHLIGSRSYLGKSIINNADGMDIHPWTRSSLDPLHHFDLFDSSSWDSLLNLSPNTVILLPWPGLPRYNELFHLTHNLPAYLKLVSSLIDSGCQNIVCVGTCYEYGNLTGCLSETLPPAPLNFYAIAKDSFRRSLEMLCESSNVRWTWSRIFYVYGIGQRPSSLYISLLDAIARHEPSFKISSGRQLRDFVKADIVARHLLYLATDQVCSGIFNCGSGTPISLFEFVDSIVKMHNSDIQIIKGAVPDRSDEPFAFWADMTKFNSFCSISSTLDGSN